VTNLNTYKVTDKCYLTLHQIASLGCKLLTTRVRVLKHTRVKYVRIQKPFESKK